MAYAIHDAGEPGMSGRPSRRSREQVARTRSVRFDLSEVEYAEISAAAVRCGQSRGAYAAVVTLAVLHKLLKEGQIDPDAATVVINSGDGLKTPDAVADSIGTITPIPATLDAFAAHEFAHREPAQRQAGPGKAGPA